MRLLVLFFTLFAVSAAFDIPLIPIPLPLPIKVPEIPLPLNIKDLDPTKLLKLFTEFMTQFNKVYLNPVAQSKALAAFSENAKKIVQFNTAFKDQNVKFGINEFSDLTDAEFASRLLQPLPANSSVFAQPKKAQFSATQYQNLPASYDWRKYANIVGPVTSQGSCGCCWAFATAAVIQSANGVKGRKLVMPSEQQICDCGKMDGTSPGCNGGWVKKAMEYAKTKGVSVETSYTSYNPARATKTYTCDDSNKPNTLKVSNYKVLSPATETDMQTAIYWHGLISAAFRVGNSFRHYKSGVITSNDCDAPDAGGHAVAIVGWGVENGIPYWTIKNSWGTSFGESGYFRIKRGGNLCNIQNYEVVYADLV